MESTLAVQQVDLFLFSQIFAMLAGVRIHTNYPGLP